MDRDEEGKRIKRSVHLPDDAWGRARLGSAILSADGGEYVSTSAFIERAIDELYAKLRGKR